MKFIIVAACLILAASAVPISPNVAARRALPAVEHQEIHDKYGQYAIRYVTAEGTVVVERGYLVPNPDGKGYVLVVEGSTSYIGDDGKLYVTKYRSGLDGAHVEGAHLPTPPPVPAVV